MTTTTITGTFGEFQFEFPYRNGDTVHVSLNINGCGWVDVGFTRVETESGPRYVPFKTANGYREHYRTEEDGFAPDEVGLPDPQEAADYAACVAYEMLSNHWA